ncbi:response regulator [Thermogemmatispora tikiterensis]|uniref:DNA-binding response regulator n=1 Tax=Thermogemmatispora tikiterensis TaxID=1825093 RepID=A0A328VJ53_9CHLR|nr:response regulator transcription factor [Thermogemmatispora tikiterensis]RAQ96911.1 DNA-binding response regulator [Thermogemmatispora tikiterensis]
MTIRILLADDHPIVREGLRAVLETQPDLTVVAEAANGEETIAQARETHPDIVLLDLEMPVLDGVEAIRHLLELEPKPRVIVFTAFDNDERILHAVRAGARGYLLKGAPREEIFQAIRVAMEGGSLLQPVVASKLLRQIGQQGGGSQTASYPYEPLTERELEVLRLLAQGMPNKEIAARLVISERTAKFHVSSIMNKLGATNRTEAVALAAQRGLITLQGDPSWR